jgi:hypothetical protein
VAIGLAVSVFLLTATLAWSQSVPGSLDVHWNEAASDCRATPQDARYPNYILTNPIRNLAALAIIAVAVLIFIVWGVRRLVRSRRSARGSKL